MTSDKNGRVIKLGDIVRLFHFVGARKKKHYMYKICVEYKGELVLMDIRDLAQKGFASAHTCRFDWVDPKIIEVIDEAFL